MADRDEQLAQIAAKHGCRVGLGRLIVKWCRHFGVPISLGFALFEHESGFRKVFGHDPTIYVGAGVVTKAKYLAYRARRRASHNRLMQGVGEGQLTWWATQDYADRLGGCWRAEPNVRVALETLAAQIKAHGYVKGIQLYNGTGPAAVAYSLAVRMQAKRWHARLS